jgi:octanoyl-[GcvH]:protein N-octanoyltransferase
MKALGGVQINMQPYQTLAVDVLPSVIEVGILEDHMDARRNLQLDEVLAKQVAQGTRPAVARLWRHAPQTGLVVSRRDIAGEYGDVAISRLREQGVEVFVRSTGGTAVPHRLGVLNFSLMFPRTKAAVTTDLYYRLLCHPMISWLETLGLAATTGEVPGSYCDGTYNVVVEGLKLVGTAQTWRGGLAGLSSRHPGYVLAHACIVIDVDLQWTTQTINTFYEATRNPYQVVPSTATTLTELLARCTPPRPPLTSEQAMTHFEAFLKEYFQVSFASVHSLA